MQIDTGSDVAGMVAAKDDDEYFQTRDAVSGFD
jgi:hypothetical protein